MGVVLQLYTWKTWVRGLWFTQARENDAVTMISRIDALVSFVILVNLASQCLIISLSLLLQVGWCRVLQSPTQLNGLHEMAPCQCQSCKNVNVFIKT